MWDNNGSEPRLYPQRRVPSLPALPGPFGQSSTASSCPPDTSPSLTGGPGGLRPGQGRGRH